MSARSGRPGQAMIEYVVALCALLMAAGATWWLVRASRSASSRSAHLAAADYP